LQIGQNDAQGLGLVHLQPVHSIR